jgi:hypothetical protein
VVGVIGTEAIREWTLEGMVPHAATCNCWLLLVKAAAVEDEVQGIWSRYIFGGLEVRVVELPWRKVVPTNPEGR